MQILINAASAHMGGAVTYLQNVLRRLPEQAAVHRVIVYVPKATTEVLPNRPEVDVRPYPYSSTRGLSRLYFDQVRMPRIAAREKVDVLLSATGFGTVWSPAPQVLLVRNMKYFDPRFEEKYRALGRSFLKTRLRRWHSLLSIGAADAVLFPTRAMEETVGTYVALGGTPTRALHYGYDGSGFTATGEAGDILAVHDIAPPDERGAISGPTGALLYEASRQHVDALGVIVEASGRFPDPAAATTLIETAVEPITGLAVETDTLLEQAEEIRATRQQLARRMQQAQEESSKAEPVGMYQ